MKINKKYLITVLFVLIGYSPVFAHPFYVSICQINFNRENSSLEISLKIFADDLAKGLENNGHPRLYIGEDQEDTKTNTYLFEYLKKELSFAVNGKPAEYRFIGKETEDAVVWSYLEIQNVNELKSLQADCTLLTDLFATQSTIIQIEKDKTIKNLLLNRQETSGIVTF